MVIMVIMALVDKRKQTCQNVESFRRREKLSEANILCFQLPTLSTSAVPLPMIHITVFNLYNSKIPVHQTQN